MKFRELIHIEGAQDDKETRKKHSTKLRQSSPRLPAGRGCDNCTLNSVKGIKKIFGRVRGKSIFVWGQSPGPVENKEGKELLGPAGKWWWNECSAAGIERKDCDIQYAIRCYPADRDLDMWPPLKTRNPTKGEIKCCSIYNEQAIEKSEARVHIILGQVAAKSLLGQEYKKNARIFWSKKLGAHVVCLDHPAFFTHRVGGAMPGSDSRLQQFRKNLRFAASVAKVGGGKYGFIHSQNYIGVTSIKLARKAYKEILADALLSRRVSADIEEGRVDSDGRPTTDNRGTDIDLVIGFCSKPGTSYVFGTGHPDFPASDRVRRYNRKIVRRLLRDRRISFLLQHGTYDVSAAKRFFGTGFANYDFDTIFGEFFTYPERHSFALDAIADARFPQFASYKSIVAPEAFTDQARRYFKEHRLHKASIDKRYTLARKTIKNGLNYALIPWEKMVRYNGADNDLQKRIELSTKKHVHMPLMHVYRDAQFVLDRMEKNPPLFDYKHYDSLVAHYPVLEDHLHKQLLKLSGKKDFNPNSPPQVAYILYKKLHLPVLGDKPNTTKETMAALAEYHPFPNVLVQYRRVKKICTTYLAGFKASADANAGCVRTIWWLTGTRTGRLSSGGGDSGEKGVVNLQNIHGDPLLQCLLVSDNRWRQVYKYWSEHTEKWQEVLRDKHGKIVRDKDKRPIKVWKFKGGFTEQDWTRFADFDVFLGFDHSQMELRCVAQKSGDKNLIKAFKSGVDIHSQVGHELTGWPVEQIKEDEGVRRLIKNMQFGIVYGLNENNLANYMRAKGVKDVNDAQVKKFYRLYFKRFSGVKRMIDADRLFAKKYGYVLTLFKFKRRLNVSENSEGGAYWGNQAVNTPIQGTAHQLMLMGLVPLKRKPKTYKLLNRPQLEIHDAIYFVVKLKNLFKAAIKGQFMLEKASVKIVKEDFGINWRVPLKAEPKGAFRFGIQVKDIGGKGPTTEWDFLNRWCEKNFELQLRLKKEHEELLEKVR
jgi:uracil-DNA glycosylase family 4